MTAKCGITTKLKIATFATGCPWSHPHPYDYYRKCCAHPTEGKGMFAPDHEYFKFCNGNSIWYKSLCCKDDEYVDCPNYDQESEDNYGYTEKGSRCVAPTRISTLTKYLGELISETMVWINLDNLVYNTKVKSNN